MPKLIIAPYFFHQNLISFYRQKDPFNDVKFLTKEELIDSFYGKFNDKSIVFLMKKFQLSYSMSKSLLAYLPFIKNDNSNAKIHYLFELKKCLIENNFYKKDFNLCQFLSYQNIDIYGYSKIDTTLNDIFNFLHVTPTYCHKNGHKQNNLFIYNDAEEEVHHLFVKIIDSINSGVNINDIFIYLKNDSYIPILCRYQNYYHIPINGLIGESIFGFEYVKRFFKYYENKIKVDDIFEMLKEFDEDENYLVFKNKILSLTDDELTYAQQLDVYNHLANFDIESELFESGLNLIHDRQFLKNKHIFVLGFAQGFFPRLFSDDEFLLDYEKKIINFPTSEQQNLISKDEEIIFLSSLNEFSFSFSYRNIQEKYYISFLKDDLNLQIQKPLLTYDYSFDASQISLLKMKDKKAKYRYINPLLNSYEKQVDFSYNTYDNDFKFFKLVNKQQKLTHSYSSLSKYLECPFAYFIKYYLKIDEDEENFNLKLGNFVHKLLEKAITDPLLSYDECFQLAFNHQIWTSKEKIFLNSNYLGLQVAFDAIKAQLEQIKNVRVEVEKELSIQLNQHSIFYGKIDKLIVADNKFLALIDYKTSNVKFTPNKINLGQSLQLPSYALLVSQHHDYQNYIVGGLYINQVIPDDINIRIDDINNLTYLKLKGRSLENLDYCLAMEPNYLNKDIKFIANIFPTGKSAFSKKGFVDDSQMKSYIEQCRKFYLEADQKIRDNQFNVSPKRYSSSTSCQYCPYNDICYVKYYQFVTIEDEEQDEEEANDGN